MENISDTTLAAWVAWFQLAIMAVPLLIFIVKLEWDDWKEAHPHPKKARKPRAREAFVLRPHPV